jgi:hypothetical protein
LQDTNLNNQPDISGAFWQVFAQAGSAGGTLTAGNSLTQNFAGKLFTFQNNNGAGATRPAALVANGAGATITPNASTELPSGVGLNANFQMGILATANGGNVGILSSLAGQSSIGVWGANTATGATNWAIGVAGSSTGGAGVGVYGQSTGTSGSAAGIYGSASNTAAISGSVVGVRGDASNTTSGVTARGVSGSVNNPTFGSAGVFGTNTATTGNPIGVYGIANGPSGGGAVGVRGESTNGSGLFATSASNLSDTAGVYGSNSSATGASVGVLGVIPSGGSAAGFGVRGENRNISGGVGVFASTAASGGRAIFSLGSVFVENRSANGSATSGADGLIVWSNTGASGFNSSGALFTPSDRNVKTGFTPVDTRSILDKVLAMPVTTWHYKNDLSTWYMGPVAQDFHAAFGLGDKDTVIHGVNADGVALAAIQGVNAKLESELKTRDAAIEDLKSHIAKSDRLLATVDRRLQNVEQEVFKSRSAGIGIGFGVAMASVIGGHLVVRRRNRRSVR